MNPDEDNEFSFDESNDSDSSLRELRIEMIRLQAEIDQLAASARERAAEIAELRDRLVDLELRFNLLKFRHRRHAQVWILIAAMYGAAAGLGFSYLMRP